MTGHLFPAIASAYLKKWGGTAIVGVAVEAGLINVGVGVSVLVGRWIMDVAVISGVEVCAISEAVAVTVGWSAAALGGVNNPVNKRLIAIIPMKRPIDRYVILARIIMVLIATINFCNEFPVECSVSAGNGGSAGTESLNHL